MDRNQVASQALTKALTFQSPVARNNFQRLRRVHPDESPKDLAERVTKYYLSLVTTSGGAMGAAGAIPGGGIPSAAFDIVAFTEASVLYALTLAEIHGIHPEDIERRRLLVQTVLIGDSAITALNKGAGRPSRTGESRSSMRSLWPRSTRRTRCSVLGSSRSTARSKGFSC
jgi:hypothetical protein